MAKASAERRERVPRQPAPERRKSARAALVVRVDYKTVDELFSEFAHNINEGGVFVETDAPPEQGSSVCLEFKLPGGAAPVRANGTVVRVSDGLSGEPPGMGVEFEELDAATRQRINELVRRLRAGS